MADFSTPTTNLADLNTEARIVDGKVEPLNFQCTFKGCRSLFNRKWKLDRHICSHTGERPFKCSEVGCSKCYQCLSHLHRHIKTAHLKLDRLPCTHQFCKATFTCKSSLIKHCKNHGKPRAFMCSKCPVSFLKITKLKKHELMHGPSSSLLCPVCNNNWSSPTMLRRHMRSHAILKCEFTSCSFVSNSRPEMRKHEKNEHRMVLICDYCKKSYNNKGILRDHITTHLPREQRGLFFCPHTGCVRGYFQKRNLRHHLKVFHNRTRYYCLFSNCYNSFDSQVRLEKHVQRYHEKYKKTTEKLIEDMANILPISDTSSLQVPKEPQCILEVVNRKV